MFMQIRMQTAKEGASAARMDYLVVHSAKCYAWHCGNQYKSDMHDYESS